MAHLNRIQKRRNYQVSGIYGATSAAPSIVERASDAEIDDAELSPLERGARDLRLELLDDLGDEPTAAQRLLVDTIVSKAVVCGTAWRFIAERCGGSLIDRRKRAIRRFALDLNKVENGLVAALDKLGLERRRPTSYLARLTAVAARNGANGTESSPAAQDGDGAGSDGQDVHPPSEAARAPHSGSESEGTP